MVGDKGQQALPLMLHLAAEGWVCVAANYRLSPRVAFPEHLLDCKQALRWTREHVAEYGGDPDFVAAIKAFTPMGRIAQPWEIRGPALFLASSASDFMTGQLLVVDGGCMAK